ncbi:MAG: prohibitin family protein [Rhodothermaceae bacterium]|nr:prohibitin family protein [Rhodothermaceae bacterium]MXZ58307.1 prohibitin family protein [Rhodothermaceae bacterium]MYB92067.1 prohibitin family protein [Rhodothermaceae bacterium]MYD67913.1 prohibitin family protein [Rhodothermaceae bacterium]MYG44111.1 prohibitin family protein [Rhodothermaceae bacterium]
MNNRSNMPNMSRLLTRGAILAAVVLVVGAMAAGCMTTTLVSGEAGVRYSIFGGTDMDDVYGEGLKVHAPWVNVIKYDVRVQERLENMEALSSNGLSIGTDISVRWRPISETLPVLHVDYGVDYFRKLIGPELRSTVREVIGQFTPEELYSTRRTELQDQIFARVKESVGNEDVLVEAILIRDVRLPEQIKMAIENKLKEEQEAERYEFTIEKERLEAERKRIEAEGEAAYQQIITASLTSQFLRFKGIEATQQLANSPNSKTVIVGGGGDGLPLILGGQ